MLCCNTHFAIFNGFALPPVSHACQIPKNWEKFLGLGLGIGIGIPVSFDLKNLKAYFVQNSFDE